MATVPVDGSTRPDGEAEGWAIRIEQLHAELDRLQQPLSLAGGGGQSDDDPISGRVVDARNRLESLALFVQQRDDLLARVDELEAERDLLLAHIADINATRLMRWSRFPRRVYGLLRGRGRVG